MVCEQTTAAKYSNRVMNQLDFKIYTDYNKVNNFHT